MGGVLKTSVLLFFLLALTASCLGLPLGFNNILEKHRETIRSRLDVGKCYLTHQDFRTEKGVNSFPEKGLSTEQPDLATNFERLKTLKNLQQFQKFGKLSESELEEVKRRMEEGAARRAPVHP